MRALIFFAAIAPLISPLLATAIPKYNKRDTGLKVVLSQVRATEVNAVMENTGTEALKLLDYGTLMDKNPIQKLNVFKDGVEVRFTGIDARYKMYDFTEDAFTTLAPGEAFTSIINIAALHDVSGGNYTVSTIGAIPYASPNTTQISGSVVYQSNILALALSEDDVAIVPRAVPVLDKRTVLQKCSGLENKELRQALGRLVNVTRIAAEAARSGDPAKFEEFFKTKDAGARQNVADRLDAISREASLTRKGATTYFCDDQYNYCDSNSLAYALPSQNLITNCPLYYTLSSFSSVCGGQDQTNTALHEFTHTPRVFSPSTQDFAYGYSASTQLGAEQALLNADNYALFANAIVNGC